MKIQKITYKDINEIATLRPEGWSDPSEIFKFYISNQYCFPIKIVIDDQIVSIGSNILHDKVAWLAHIIVKPEFRNNGLGKLITKTLLENAFAQNCETINLCATDMGARVYIKLNFVLETHYLFYKQVKIETPVISDRIKKLETIHQDQVLQLDHKISGENRISTIENHLANGYVYLEENKVSGFYLPTLVDGLIVAATETAGLALTKLRLNTFNFASFPENNQIAKAFFAQNNYHPYKKERRMRYGKKRSLCFENIYNRIAGKLG